VAISGTYDAEVDFQNDFTLTTTADLIQVTGTTHNVTINSGSTLQFAFLNVPSVGHFSKTVTIVQNNSGGALSGAPFTVELPAQLLGLVEYAVNSHFTLRLNLYNLTDERYIRNVNNNGGRYNPGTPRSAMLTTAIRF